MESSNQKHAGMRAVDPVKPVAPYIGGKKQLADHIIKRIEAIPHSTYAEAFVGMGGVFLRRRSAPKSELINDISGDVANFFRILQRHYVPFMDMLKFQITSRAEFLRLKDAAPETLTDLERAVRFLYLQRLAFGGKVRSRTFGVSSDRPARFDVSKLEPLLTGLNERLSGVVIEQLPYADFIRRYDHLGALFYLDPPYFGCEDFYGANVFSRDDFARLAGVLRQCEGRFLLSINDTLEIREIFSGFDFEEVDLNYSVSMGGGTKAHELIISNG